MGFKDIEDGSAVISTGGVYQEVGLVEMDGPLFKDRFGRLCVTGGEGRRPLIATDDGKLLEAG